MVRHHIVQDKYLAQWSKSGAENQLNIYVISENKIIERGPKWKGFWREYFNILVDEDGKSYLPEDVTAVIDTKGIEAIKKVDLTNETQLSGEDRSAVAFYVALQYIRTPRYREKQAEILNNASQIGHSVADLETEKAAAFRAFIAATSPVVKEGMESEIERLDKEIKAAQGVRNKLEITENDITYFIQEVKYIMEHPSELLINPANITQQQNLYALVFDEFPDYSQILNGTPKLSWIFKPSSEFVPNKSELVTLPGVEPGFKA